jgi:hypothetical protein
LFSTCESVSELFTILGMKGERIRLLLVILPENTGCHGMLVILFWSDSPLTFLVCLVTLAYNYLVWVS